MSFKEKLGLMAIVIVAPYAPFTIFRPEHISGPFFSEIILCLAVFCVGGLLLGSGGKKS